MNPFEWNHLLYLLILMAVCSFLPSKKGRTALLTALALGGVVLSPSIHWSLGLTFIFLSMSVVTAAWLFGKSLIGKDPARTKGRFIVAMVVLFAPLFLFKLVMALIPLAVLKNVQENAPGFTMAKMIPVGISYFSFRCAAYLIEIRRGTIATVGFWRLLHYAFFWPTLFAGPIERPGPFFEQSEKMERPSRDDRILGLYRMMIGFLKKTVLAGIFAAVARPFLGLGADFTTRFEAISAPHLWLCVIAYYLYLYLDFSAYSDLAIGASRLLGFRIMENFRWPILATNISEFWQRWHISLTSWVTDYIYRPLGGSRNGLAKAARYSMIAMVIIGAWHGMNPHFIVWGAFHAVFLTLYRYWRKVWQPKFFPDGKPGPAWLRTSLAWLLTHVIVSLGWVLFNFPVGQSLRIWAKMFGLS